MLELFFIFVKGDSLSFSLMLFGFLVFACSLLGLAVAVLALAAVVLLDFAAQDGVVGHAKDHVEPDDMHDLKYVQENVEQVICWKVAKVERRPVGGQMQDSVCKQMSQSTCCVERVDVVELGTYLSGKATSRVTNQLTANMMNDRSQMGWRRGA